MFSTNQIIRNIDVHYMEVYSLGGQSFFIVVALSECVFIFYRTLFRTNITKNR